MPFLYNAVVWDWNGTLLDDTSVCADLVSQELVRRNCSAITIERFRDVYQHPIKNMYTELGLVLTDHEYMQLSHGWLDTYEQARQVCSLQVGALQGLEKLRALEVNQLILSAHRHDLLHIAVADHNVGHYFSSILGLELGGGSSKLSNGLKVIGQLHDNDHKVLIIGDSVHDAEVASATGADCHLVARGADARWKLEATGYPVFTCLEEWQSKNLL